MTVRFSDLEKLGIWCANAEEMEDAIEQAAPIFFEGADEGLTEYADSAGDYASVERRFFGWFMFGYTLPGGERPAEIAARNVFKRRRLDEVLAAIGGARFVVGSITAVHPNRAVFVKVVDQQEMEIRDKRLADPSTRDMTLLTWVLPARPKVWIPGPGWLVMPLVLGSGLRRNMDLAQWSPIELERILRTTAPEETGEAAGFGGMFPKDLTLAEAVDRITKAAEADRRPALVLSEPEWERLVLGYMMSMDNTGFWVEVIERAGADVDDDGIDLWLGMAQDIWNATPQPDRGGNTATELFNERG